MRLRRALEMIVTAEPAKGRKMGETRWHRMYGRLPVWMQNLACSAVGLKMRRARYGKVFREAFAFLQESQWWSLQELKAYQDEKLQQVVKHAYQTVPYYTELFDSLKLKPEDIKSVEDLPKLPILTKDILRQRGSDMFSKGWPARRISYGHTGGTTGTALTLASDIDTTAWQWAVWWRHRYRFGLKLNDPFIVLAGRSVVPMSRMDPPFWRRNLSMHQTYVSIHHMTQPNMPALVSYLHKRKVRYYSGYPSALYLLATYLLDNGITLNHQPEFVVTGAETVLPHQRRVIEQGIGARLTDQYGASEHCGNISECQLHSYHVDMEFGAVEFLADPNLPTDVKRIVCTGFQNPVMPLIRYDIGDLATITDQPCTCKMQSPQVLKIDGRIESYVITPDGRQLGRLDFLFKGSRRIREAQLIQRSIDRLLVKVVRSNGYDQSDEQELLGLIRHYLGDVIEVDIEYIDEIPRGANGKFRQIVSEVFRDRHRNLATTSSTDLEQ
jgi:phenylacetate-CoA ligase